MTNQNIILLLVIMSDFVKDSDLSELVAKAEKQRDDKQKALNQALHQLKHPPSAPPGFKRPSSSPSSSSPFDVLDSLNVSEMTNLVDIEHLEQILDQQLSLTRTRKYSVHKYDSFYYHFQQH